MEIVMKKIKRISSNVFVRLKVIICLTIVAIVVLTAALLLTGCNGGSQNENAGYQNSFSDVGPAWSPDGSKIAFIKPTYYNRGSNWGVIWVMNTDGSNKVKLTDDTEKLNSPAWSPDGTKIVFRGLMNKSDIWIMNADGSKKINLTNSASYYFNQTWSPDGSKIAFDSGEDEGGWVSDIWVMDAEGSNKIKLTDKYSGGFPTWSPDSSKIAFSSTNK